MYELHESVELLARRVERLERRLDFQSNFNFSRAVHLVDMIRRHFNESELNSLMMTLGINYEEIIADSHTERVREFVSYCERRNMIDALILICQSERPLAQWPY